MDGSTNDRLTGRRITARAATQGRTRIDNPPLKRQMIAGGARGWAEDRRRAAENTSAGMTTKLTKATDGPDNAGVATGNPLAMWLSATQIGQSIAPWPAGVLCGDRSPSSAGPAGSMAQSFQLRPAADQNRAKDSWSERPAAIA